MAPPDDTAYDGQSRGDRRAYERYLRGMDASMQQKIALTAAHLLSRGTVADMGMGSGTGAFSLAALYPSLQVIGVDVSEAMVALATQRHRLDNLRFVLGDIAQPVFEARSLDGIFDSSVLHHVTSFGGYRHAAAADALAVQVQALRDGGVLIVRDFVAPSSDETVWLDVADDDGSDDAEDPTGCNTAALLQRFAAEFRSLSDAPGFTLTEVDPAAGPPLAAGRRRFALSRRLAVEFILRKDYRRDWDAEVKEEYTYFDQAGFEAALAGLGLRVLASTPIRNPWIVANRYMGKFSWWSVDGEPLPLPPTNFVVVGQRVSPQSGVRFAYASAEPGGFLELLHYRRTDTQSVFDLVRRPNLTLDAIPWFARDDEVFVLTRMSYPRPLLGLADGAGLDGSRAPGWITEPLTIIAGDKPDALTVEDALVARIGLPAASIRAMTPGLTYYPSPGGIAEEVRSRFVHIDAVDAISTLPDTSGWSSSGRFAAVEARQLLRAAQVGGLPDARLEMAVYVLLARMGREPGPWIGAAIEPAPAAPPPATSPPSALLARRPRRCFTPTDASARFMEIRGTEITEFNAAGAAVHTKTLEYAVPRTRSTRTVAAALLWATPDGILIGVDDDDLPAAQCIEGNSSLLVTPAWRLPTAIEDLSTAEAWTRERLGEEYGLRAGRAWPLGGRYHPAPGSTPELVHPLAFEVIACAATPPRPLAWTPLDALLQHPALLRDGHLRIVAHRAAHALGLLRVAAP